MIRERGQTQFIICLPPLCQYSVSAGVKFTRLRTGKYLIKPWVSLYFIRFLVSLQSSWECLNMLTRKRKKEDSSKNSYSVDYPTFHPCYQNLKFMSNRELTNFIHSCGRQTKHPPSAGQLNTMKNSNTWWWNHRRWNLQQTGEMTFIFIFLRKRLLSISPPKTRAFVSSHTREQTLNKSSDRC